MGDTEVDGKLKRMVFVTVGTTCFDALVRAVDTEQVKQKLYARGYTHLLIQMGRGTYNPTEYHGEDGLVVEYFSFSSSIADHLKSASLVISHAGSGSIFETLRLGKPLIVVVNEDLMDNHQIELAEELAERKHLYCARPQTLRQTIESLNLDFLIPYTQGDAKPVARLINRFLGFPED
ncbi:UDP-N-acetylglucosamine transferase subunit ALG13 homolog [Cucurbita maxima]|uniref:UDP-N-acetylglucosamine transferase subunit ALG13 homolog n=1 Tax=Cucurbita maxima TaxID=3661 RepID=A0A6J1HRY7_CUCMA|nr:UDP-N-acetylglucosamine transferase subunit ALG13 homolog [Cucurbita maxima]XP_022965791.1 UDP-N-acetylglucosamine transferase subunit ALG13 homolog [Cucurbita maxima]XP_022965799.1 UDP-N-acetylglucosamine transferase subunit ALG13 homolog [Cucurbita maxima]